MDSRTPFPPDADTSRATDGAPPAGAGTEVPTQDSAPRPFEFRWRKADGKVTVLNCLARTETEAEESARRAGWPGHDGTRLGRYRAWLRQAVLSDLSPAPPPAAPDDVVPPPVRAGQGEGDMEGGGEIGA